MESIVIDDAFFNQTGLERVGVIGPELGLLLDWSAGFGVILPCKDKKEERSVRPLLEAAPMPKTVP